MYVFDFILLFCLYIIVSVEVIHSLVKLNNVLDKVCKL